jgi:MFS family permease
MGSGRIYFFGALGGFIKNDFDLSPFLEGAIVSSLLLGAMPGAGLAGPLSDRLGRRKPIIAAGTVFTVGAILAAAAPTVGVLLAARFILGVAVGCAALVVPLYLSEIAPTEIRGAIASLNQLMIVGGIGARVRRGVARDAGPRGGALRRGDGHRRAALAHLHRDHPMIVALQCRRR